MKKPPRPGADEGALEQGTGVEPALTAWEAAVIPIYQPCISNNVLIIAESVWNCKANFGICFRVFCRFVRALETFDRAKKHGILFAIFTV